MSATILAVRARDYAEQLSPASFSALPREEIERLYARLDVLAVPAAEAHAGAGYLPLHTLTALHYNYTWLTFGEAPRRLGVVHPLSWAGQPPAFLDDALQRQAEHAVQAQLALPECDWRLVGLLRDARLTLVYVARLRRAWHAPTQRDGTPLQPYGSGQLQLARAEFDPWSQLLIDHLHAF